MKSKATTAAAYLDSLPPDRRDAIMTVRRVILENLDPVIEECMQYGVVGYCVPHRVWPHGHHTNAKLPLMYMGLSSQKNDMVVYMLFLLHSTPERAWLDKAWKATGRTSHLEVGGMGCCLRFKKVEDLSLDVIAEAIRRMPVKKYLDDHIAMLARLGKGPDGKPLTQVATKGATKPATKPTTKAEAKAEAKAATHRTPSGPSTVPAKDRAAPRKKSAKKSAEKPATKPAQKPAQKTAQKTAKKPATKSAPKQARAKRTEGRR